jgi:hypothetical protein
VFVVIAIGVELCCLSPRRCVFHAIQTGVGRGARFMALAAVEASRPVWGVAAVPARSPSARSSLRHGELILAREGVNPESGGGATPCDSVRPAVVVTGNMQTHETADLQRLLEAL